MTAMRTSSFTHNFLLLFAGPLIWAVHFIAIYAVNGILCARLSASETWTGIAAWAVAGAGALAIAAMAAIGLWVRPRDATPDSHAFIQWVSLMLSLLASVAIVWETLPVFLVPACA
jgi:hypothetical protein